MRKTFITSSFFILVFSLILRIGLTQIVGLSDNSRELSFEHIFKDKETEKYFNLGGGYLEKRDYIKSLQNYYIADSLAEQRNNIGDQIEILKKIGVIHLTLKRNETANLYFDRVYKLANLTGDTSVLIDILVKRAQIDIENENVLNAKRALYYSFYLLSKDKNCHAIKLSLIYRNLGLLYLKQQNYSIALYYYSQTLKNDMLIRNTAQIGSLYTLISHIYKTNNNNRKSLEYNFKALHARKLYNQTDQYISSLINIGRSYMSLNLYDSAQFFLEKGITLGIKHRQIPLLEYGYKSMYELYLIKKNNFEAIKFLERYSEYKDSVNAEINKRELANYMTNLIVMNNEKATLLLKHENSLQKLQIKERTILFFLFLFLFLFTLVLCILLYFVLVKNRKAKRTEEKLNETLRKEIADRIQAEQNLVQSEQNYRFISNNVLDVITRFDTNFKRYFISPSCERVWGYTCEELVGMKDILSIVHPDSHHLFPEALNEIRTKKEPVKMLYKAQRKDGRYFWAQNHVNPIINPETGEIVELVSVMRDVTKQVEEEEALKAASRKKELLMKEVNHRVKNNFTILASLTGMHKSSISDKKFMDLLSDLQFRVRTMALVHEQLYSANSYESLPVRSFLCNLINIISNSFNDDRVDIHISIIEENIDPAIAMNLGLILNELITNAFKHAFPESRKGNIWIEYSVDASRDDKSKRTRKLFIKDDGIGISEKGSINQGNSLGNTIVQLLAAQLEAEPKIRNDNGLSFTLTFSIDKFN